MNKPTAFDVYSTEKAMQMEFWHTVRQYQERGLIKPYSIFAVSNNQSHKFAGYNDKLMGTVAGVSDLYVPSKGALEAKIYKFNPVKKDGTRTIAMTKQSKEQLEFQAYIESIGLEYKIFHTPNEGLAILQDWGILTGEIT